MTVASEPFDPRGPERGSVMMLFPAAVLIVLVLGAIAVDRAVVFGAQRDLVATASAAANDAAGLSVDVAGLRRGSDLDLVDAEIDRRVRLVAARIPGLVSVSWHRSATVVVVRMEREVELVFAPALPGASRSVTVTATADAELRQRGP